MLETLTWETRQLLQGPHDPCTALIILNQPIPYPESLKRLWVNTSIHICADGGANRLMECFTTDSDRASHIPDAICGDLDSLNIATRAFYSSSSCPIVHDQDQDTTDFQKSLAWLRAFAPHITTVYVLGAPGGRFDHSMAAIHTLYMNSDIKMYLVSNESMAFLLLPGPRHVIQVDTQTQGPTCGLLPVGSEGVRMNTEGLKWNLDSSMPLQFGKLVSSSNAFDVSPSELTTRHSVLATTNKPVVFTVQIDLSKI